MWARTRIATGGGNRESGHGLIPTDAMCVGGLGAWQTAVDQVHECPALYRRERDLDRALAGVDRRCTALPAPAERHALGRVELEVLADGDPVTVHHDAIHAARTGIERRLLAHPTDDLRRVGEELEHRCRRCVDVNL